MGLTDYSFLSPKEKRSVVEIGLNIISFFIPFVGFFRVISVSMYYAGILLVENNLIASLIIFILGIFVAYFWDKWVLRKIWKDKLSMSYYLEKLWKKIKK